VRGVDGPGDWLSLAASARDCHRIHPGLECIAHVNGACRCRHCLAEAGTTRFTAGEASAGNLIENRAH